MSPQTQAVVRPPQPSDTWTFSLALQLLKSSPEHAASNGLDDFLAHNKDAVLLPVPFAPAATNAGGPQKDLDAAKTDFSLRGVRFAGVTPQAVRAAQTLSSTLAMDAHDALRIVLQTDRRSPQPAPGDHRVSRLLFGAPAPGPAAQSRRPSSAPAAGLDRMLLYTKAVLQERRTVLRIAAECLNLRHADRASPVARNLGKSLVASADYLLDAVAGLGTLVDLATGPPAGAAHGRLLRMELLLHMAQLLLLVFDVLLSCAEVPPRFAGAWFALMDRTAFALALVPCAASKDAFSVLHGLVTVVSLQLLDLPLPDPTHLADPAVFAQINALMLTLSPNNILAYAWLIRLHRKAILLEAFPQSHEAFLLVVPLQNTLSDVATLQASLQHAPVFLEIVQLNKVLGFDNVFAVILTDMILAAIPLVQATENILACISEVLSSAPNPSVEKFFDNDEARRLIVLARAKFPVSLSPYLKLACINGKFALHELEELSCYMSVFDNADLTSLHEIDSENTDLVRLTKPVDVFLPFEPANKLSLVLKVGTKAKIFPAAQDKLLVTFLHKYNGWALLGRVLENISKFSDQSELEKTRALESILDVLIRTTAEDPPSTCAVLEYMSTHTDDSDIVDVLFRVFEQSMHNRNVVLLTKLLRLLSSLMPVIPARIWPYLSRSSLLSNKGKEGFLSILFGSIETVLGEYLFTSALVKFVFCLADNCLSVTKDYSEEAKSDIFTKFIEHIIQVFENYENCKFNDSFQKFELGVLILDVFSQTLNTVYSVSPHLKIDEKPTKVFAKASQKILDTFLTTTPSFARSSISIIDLIDSLSSPSDSFDAQDISGFLGDVWIHSVFSFARLLVNIRSSINALPSKLEESLFSRLPQLVTIYSEGGPLRKVILDLLTALTSGKWESEKMPSILSHLGQDHSRILLHSLATDLESTFDEYNIKISIYDFLCSIMEANQQGLAVLFISGRDVFGEFSDAKDGKTGTKTISLLSVMKKNIQDVKSYPAAVTVHLLDAISLAFNSWTTARNEDSDIVFVKELVSLLENFEKNHDEKTAPEMILSSYDCKVYSKITEIISLVLFTTKNEKCIELIRGLLSSSAFIEKLPGFFTISGYEVSLYENVKTRFNTVFENHQLTDFAVALKKRNRFGPGMVYDLLLLDSFFQESPEWSKIREEIIYLSANMQYYNAQISLCKSMGALMTTFCRRLPTSVPTQYSKVVHKLLAIREPRDNYSELLCSQQYYERIELAFLMLYTLNDTKDGRKELVSFSISIIEECSDLMNNPNVGYLSSNKADFSYRSLLRIVYIALANLKSDFQAVNTRVQPILRLFEYVIAKGTTSIIIELQNDVYLARTNKNHKPVNLGARLDDLKLILSVLKVFVELGISGSLQAEFAATLTRHNTVGSLLSLYSFSHLTLVANEPIFAQLSLMFIQQLMLVEAFAENIVDSKIFTVIRESMISQLLRVGGVSVVNASQLHGTWTNGILPLVVLCLSQGKAVGESVLTLKAFSKQIEFSIESWSNDSSALQISSAGTFETMQLLYIFQILMSIATAQGLATRSANDVDMTVLPGLDTQQKRNDFVGFISNLLKHPKFLKSRVFPSSQEEKALMHADGREYETFVEGLIEDIKELRDFLM
ncbi:hypothetical protein METBIDRAFT_31535 [Metschnikowia bicuspidata var. bicuspidata NRRL YB-4993]|uniref:Nucleoporin NUP188 n=1 Tax=Metschnikowia bicuspidata var. bicuspidata NRRL YB-4993 TaxID=869754 RepID=A0A1A0H9R5_9ASCO|nr:hypothetical protein METBIDRAFT_31535 [Metschnikowia bicuspidata var. bicuspidata NRRL YB-4993]OBA20869.1 hypothetical protein METBIDRAFT_31535 [Metschnikowia bicuspidata var. bicuspidata NRRL YB-4993]